MTPLTPIKNTNHINALSEFVGKPVKKTIFSGDFDNLYVDKVLDFIKANKFFLARDKNTELSVLVLGFAKPKPGMRGSNFDELRTIQKEKNGELTKKTIKIENLQKYNLGLIVGGRFNKLINKAEVKRLCKGKWKSVDVPKKIMTQDFKDLAEITSFFTSKQSTAKKTGSLSISNNTKIASEQVPLKGILKKGNEEPKKVGRKKRVRFAN